MFRWGIYPIDWTEMLLLACSWAPRKRQSTTSNTISDTIWQVFCSRRTVDRRKRQRIKISAKSVGVTTNKNIHERTIFEFDCTRLQSKIPYLYFIRRCIILRQVLFQPKVFAGIEGTHEAVRLSELCGRHGMKRLTIIPNSSDFFYAVCFVHA